MDYICEICGKECKSAQSLGGHKMIHLPKREFICEYCGKVFFTSEQAFKHHVTQSHINIKTNTNSISSFNKQRDDLFCKYCNKQCKTLNSLKNHEIRCKYNPNAIEHVIPKTFSYKGRVGWSKGLTKYTDERLQHVSDGVNRYLDTCNHHTKGTKHTEEYKNRLSEYAIEHNYYSHFGKKKIYHYNDSVFDSSFELAVAKDLDNNGIAWIKPGRFIYKDMNNKNHTYTPDFYLPDYNVYLDPKNDFLINNVNPTLGYKDIDKIKWASEQNNIKVIILNESQLTWDKIKRLI